MGVDDLSTRVLFLVPSALEHDLYTSALQMLTGLLGRMSFDGVCSQHGETAQKPRYVRAITGAVSTPQSGMRLCSSPAPEVAPSGGPNATRPYFYHVRLVASFLLSSELSPVPPTTHHHFKTT
jgi:hypothetical protein